MANTMQINPAAIPASVHAIAGAFGGVASLTVTYPLFALVTRMAVQRENKKNALAVFLEIVQKEGVSGLFTGWNSAVVATFVSQFVYYYWYEFLRTWWSQEGKRVLTVSENLLIASIAGAATAAATNPIWLVNSRIATRSKNPEVKQLSSFQTAKEVVRESGVAGLFNGVGPSLILVSNPTIQYGVYEKIKVLVEEPSSAGKLVALTSFQVFYLGAIAKAIATVLTFPVQIAKTRFQVSNQKESKKTVVDVLRDIYNESGFAGFFFGMETKIVQSVLTAAFLFMFKDNFLVYTVNLLKAVAPQMLLPTAAQKK